jgi:hypothetical protein
MLTGTGAVREAKGSRGLLFERPLSCDRDEDAST